MAMLFAAFLLDRVSGNEVSSTLFYVVGITVASWFIDRRAGLLAAFLSTIAWGAAVWSASPAFSNANVFCWNLGVELVIYCATALVVARVHQGLREQRALVERLTAVTRALERETRAVGDLQREMLPPGPPRLPGYEWQLFRATSTQAGGDYHDFLPLGDGRIGILVADASGHGAQAAVLVAMMRVLLRTTEEPMRAPDRVMSRLGNQIASTIPAGRFATAFYGVLDPATGNLTYTLAGHPPPLVLRAAANVPEPLPMCGGPPLGLFPDSRFEPVAIRLLPGDTLILYTDGLTEGMSPTQELFGEPALVEALSGTTGLSLAELRDRVLSRLDRHRAGAVLEDDLTLLMLRKDARPAGGSGAAGPEAAEDGRGAPCPAAGRDRAPSGVGEVAELGPALSTP